MRKVSAGSSCKRLEDTFTPSISHTIIRENFPEVPLFGISLLSRDHEIGLDCCLQGLCLMSGRVRERGVLEIEHEDLDTGYSDLKRTCGGAGELESCVVCVV